MPRGCKRGRSGELRVMNALNRCLTKKRSPVSNQSEISKSLFIGCGFDKAIQEQLRTKSKVSVGKTLIRTDNQATSVGDYGEDVFV